ncbi:hypothetical protein BJ508DRAFT_313174 [Ascobolus immersus RN42]|uniref:Uncharacterized protein n=1 Tax=Ascobolus immersus RN42 TaxID=1160509 RepID=A0A3N4HQ22_ASCIM|nr:hypothetical protein BJ508DRAFT_313174 [Ascobolus immersus RN42]
MSKKRTDRRRPLSSADFKPTNFKPPNPLRTMVKVRTPPLGDGVTPGLWEAGSPIVFSRAGEPRASTSPASRPPTTPASNGTPVAIASTRREWMRTPPTDSTTLGDIGISASWFETRRKTLPLEGPVSFTSKSVNLIDLTSDGNPIPASAAKLRKENATGSTPSQRNSASSKGIEVIDLDPEQTLPASPEFRRLAKARPRRKQNTESLRRTATVASAMALTTANKEQKATRVVDAIAAPPVVPPVPPTPGNSTSATSSALVSRPPATLQVSPKQYQMDYQDWFSEHEESIPHQGFDFQSKDFLSRTQSPKSDTPASPAPSSADTTDVIVIRELPPRQKACRRFGCFKGNSMTECRHEKVWILIPKCAEEEVRALARPHYEKKKIGSGTLPGN